MAKSIPASCSNLASACDTAVLRSSYEPAQPTNQRYSACWVLSPKIGTSKSSCSVQADRRSRLSPQGLPWFSMATNALDSSAGKLDSIIVR